jgi:hypothetical protein
MAIGFQPPGAFITHLMKCGFKRYGPVNTVDDFEVHNLDLTSLQLDVGILVPFVISKRLSGYQIINSEQLGKVLPDVLNLTQKSQRKFVVLTVGGKLTSIEERLVEDMGLSGIAAMDWSTINRVLETNDQETKAKLLSAALVRYLGREALSPYVTGSPAIGGRFFGRSSLIKTIVPTAGNFTIIGNRRIGKTSLLKEIKHRLRLQNFITAEVYGTNCGSTSDVVHRILQSLGKPREAERVYYEPQRASGLPTQVHSVGEAQKRPVAVFIDEVDRILEFDEEQDYQVLHLLRETFEGTSSCRVFLAGFRKVMEASQSISSPLFNFTRPIELPLFSRQETFEMVIKPLERMGIAISTTSLPEAIYQETSGHPELIQIYCSAIIRVMHDHNQVPSATELVNRVFNTGEYKRRVLGTLVNANPHEQLLCYLLMLDAQRTTLTADYSFEPKDVHRVLSRVGINLEVGEIAAIIINLKVSGIISRAAGNQERYRFSAARLVDYCSALNLESLIEQAMERVKEQAEGVKRSKHSAIFADTDEPEPTKTSRPAEEKSLKTDEHSGAVIRIKNLAKQVKHIYLMPYGGVMVTEAEGTDNFPGSLDDATIDDLNNRCLDIVNHWTTHGIFEQRLRGIGTQLSDALKLRAPDLLKHLNPTSDRQQFVIVTTGEGLKIPFELLPHEKSNLAVTAGVARRLLNYRLPSDLNSPFHQLVTSLSDTTSPLRILLVASDPQATIPDATKELTVVRKHIEAGCRQSGLRPEYVEILPPDATVENLEKILLQDRPFHLWHFTGHGKHFSEDAEKSGIVLLGDDKAPEIISRNRLNRWLKGSGLWLAYLSCCHTSAASGSATGLSQKYVGTMEAVLGAGIPNVIGFRWAVSDQSAFHLADEFYRQLFEVQTEKNLSLAMLEARRAVERRADFFDAWAASMLVTQYS